MWTDELGRLWQKVFDRTTKGLEDPSKAAYLTGSARRNLWDIVKSIDDHGFASYEAAVQSLTRQVPPWPKPPAGDDEVDDDDDDDETVEHAKKKSRNEGGAPPPRGPREVPACTTTAWARVLRV
eukprot:scaffold4978_cov117-Isochrysis_galbana.AAC.1